MDYKIYLKNIKMTIEKRQEIESMIEDISGFSTKFFKIEVYLKKENDTYLMKLKLINDVDDLVSPEFKGEEFSEVVEKTKELVINQILLGLTEISEHETLAS